MVEPAADERPASSLPTLSSIAKVVRGVATGANSYFCLSREETQKHAIPQRYLTPVITQTRLVQNYKLDPLDIERFENEGRKVWLFNCQEPRKDTPLTVQAYIEKGEQLGLHKRSLLKAKKGKWYMAERRNPPPILFTYLGRANTRFVYNAAGVQALNAFLLIYPDELIARDPHKVKALTAILNSSPIKQRLHLVGRSYGGDTVKLEPREMDKLPVLDPRHLDADELKLVNRLFDEFCRKPNSPKSRLPLMKR